MSDRTFQDFYRNEVRALQLTIENEDGQDYSPSAAYVTISDEDGNTVVSEQPAMTAGANVYTLVGTTTTSATGMYNVDWKLERGAYTFYHRTELEVKDL